MSWTPRVLMRRNTAQSVWRYSELDSLQRQIASQVRSGEAGTVILSEVAPVITRGRRTVSSDLLVSSDELQARGIELMEVDRGGLATYHGPGQWVVFPVESVELLTGDPRGVLRIVSGLLEAALRVCKEFDPDAETRSGAELGVWGKGGKYVSLGVHVEDGVLLHGIALNVLRTPMSFYGLRPCGLDSAVAFLAEAAPGVVQDDRVFQGIGQDLVRKVVESLGSLRRSK